MILVPVFFSSFQASKASTCFIPWSSIVFTCFSNALTRGEYVNLACSIILIWSGLNITSPVRYSYLSIFPDDNADISAASLLILYCSFSSLILLTNVMNVFYILSNVLHLKQFAVHFL